jgi:two-component system, NarL family, nitrate/nitrite response regulator NarL
MLAIRQVIREPDSHNESARMLSRADAGTTVEPRRNDDMKTLLLIDDQVLFRESLALLLRQRLPEVHVLEAGSLQLARRCCAQATAKDLVVLDFLPKPSRAGAVVDALPHPLLDTTLSGRQHEVLGLLVEGKSNKLICRALDLSEATVKSHLQAIFRKLDVNSRTQAVVAAVRLGLYTPASLPVH